MTNDLLQQIEALLAGTRKPQITQPVDPIRQARLKGWLPNAYTQYVLSQREQGERG